MKSRRQGARRLATLLLTALLLSSAGGAPRGRSAKVAGLKAKRAATVAQRRKVESKLREVKQQQANAAEELNSTEHSRHAAEQSLRLSRVRLTNAERRLGSTERELVEVNRSLEAQTDALWQRLEVFYKEGNVGYVAVALGASDFEQFVDRAVLLRSLAEDDIALKQRIEADAERKQALKAEREQTVKELESLRRQYADKVARLDAEAARKEKILARIRADRAAQDQVYAELLATQREVEKALFELQTPAPHLNVGGGGASNFGGRFVRPSGGGVTCAFGWRIHPLTHTRRFHDGVDLGAGYGATIRAAAGGTVIRSGNMRAYGQALMINHGNGYVTLYGHCSALLASVGQHVTAGQPIGRVGSTGWSTGPHLHFSVYKNGVAVNPL